MSAAATAPGGLRRPRGLSPLFAFFHALSFCVELFKREIRGSFMLICRTKARARGRRPGRGPEAGADARGGGRQAARVSRVPLGLTKQPLIPANTKRLLSSGRRAARTGARAPLGPDGWHCCSNARSRPVVALGQGGSEMGFCESRKGVCSRGKMGGEEGTVGWISGWWMGVSVIKFHPKEYISSLNRPPKGLHMWYREWKKQQIRGIRLD